MLEQKDSAAKIMQEVLKIEPQLTLARLRVRMQGIDEDLWKNLAEGLRRAGLPE